MAITAGGNIGIDMDSGEVILYVPPCIQIVGEISVPLEPMAATTTAAAHQASAKPAEKK